MKLTLAFAAVLAAPFSFAVPAFADGIDGRLSTADPANGERLFRQCKACHTVEKGGASRVGPNIYSVVGAEVASVDGYRYSSALRDLGGNWTADQLDGFLENPRKAVSGTKMSFRGLSDPRDRADVIAYLNQQSDAPLDLGAAGGDAAAEDSAGSPAEDFGQLVLAPGAEETFYACTACHSEMIVAQQGKTREAWDKLFDWMIEEQGMQELDAEERTVILDYLAEHYNTDRPNFPRP